MAPGGGVTIRSDEQISIGRAHKASGIAKDVGKPMDDLDYGTKEVDEFAIFGSIFFELVLSLQK